LEREEREEEEEEELFKLLLEMVMREEVEGFRS